MKKFIQLIADKHNRVCILGEKVERPSDSWLALQTIPMDRNGDFYRAYPITGGAVIVDANDVKYALGQPTAEQIEEILGLGDNMFNPAADDVKELIGY